MTLPAPESRSAGLLAAGIILALVLLCLPYIERIPEPVLAAIVIHAVSKSLRLTALRTYFRWRRDRLISVIAIVAVLAFGMLNGLLFAIAFSLAMLLQTLARPRLAELDAWERTTSSASNASPIRSARRKSWCCAPKSPCCSPTPIR